MARGTGKRIALSTFMRARDVAQSLQMEVGHLAKRVCVKRNRQFHAEFGCGTYVFPSLKNIILPFSVSSSLARDLGFTPTPIDVLAGLEDSSATHKQSMQSFVAVMGHFDHGKTSLIHRLCGADEIRKSYEEGGITQSVNAFNAALHAGEDDSNPQLVSFLDTPGQFHFSRMRDEACEVAGMVLLVVAADDGVGLQTAESIGAAEYLDVPVLVALNKTDLANSNQLASTEEELREYTMLENARMVPVSAFSGEGMQELSAAILETIDNVVSASTPAAAPELENPASDYENENEIAIADGFAVQCHGVVLEAQMCKGVGHVLRVLVQHGTVRKGDAFVCGMFCGRVKQLSVVRDAIFEFEPKTDDQDQALTKGKAKKKKKKQKQKQKARKGKKQEPEQAQAQAQAQARYLEEVVESATKGQVVQVLVGTVGRVVADSYTSFKCN